MKGKTFLCLCVISMLFGPDVPDMKHDVYALFGNTIIYIAAG
jgi:hypothetical protein